MLGEGLKPLVATAVQILEQESPDKAMCRKLPYIWNEELIYQSHF